MKIIDQIYSNGEFVTPHGQEILELYNPATNEIIGNVRLANEVDTQIAVLAAKKALTSFSQTTKASSVLKNSLMTFGATR